MKWLRKAWFLGGNTRPTKKIQAIANPCEYYPQAISGIEMLRCDIKILAAHQLLLGSWLHWTATKLLTLLWLLRIQHINNYLKLDTDEMGCVKLPILTILATIVASWSIQVDCWKHDENQHDAIFNDSHQALPKKIHPKNKWPNKIWPHIQQRITPQFPHNRASSQRQFTGHWAGASQVSAKETTAMA